MRAVVKKWGNSAAVRIPRGVMQAARLEIEQTVEISEADGQVLIAPVRPELDLKQLLRGITRANLHEPADFRRTGRERVALVARRYVPAAWRYRLAAVYAASRA